MPTSGCSSADQNTARQEESLLKAGFQPDKIYVEHASAKDTNRPELQKLLEQLRPGDTLLVHSIDRLCRNMMDMCAVTTRPSGDGRYPYFSEGAAYVQCWNKQSNAGVTVAHDVCIQSV
ncbi:recombinase family protein [Escherichia coli]|nr:recombinase family protein [Escherichia coli]